MRLHLLTLAAALLAAVPLHAQVRPLVVIDPGHGGSEAGVVTGDAVEKDLILEVAFVIGAEFVKAGYDVHFTRTRDVEVQWEDRRGEAEAAGAVALFMLHAMQNEDPAVGGAEIYFDETTAASVELSAAVAEGIRELGIEAAELPRPWPFLQSQTVPTSMIELVHLTNPRELALLRDPAFQRRLGSALVAALEGRDAPAPVTDEAAVLAVAEASLDAISAEDMVAFTDLMVEEAVIAPTGEDYVSISSRAAERARTLPGDIVERGFDAEVRVSGRVASVWLPYDLYIDGAWSHCGVDAFTMVKRDDSWRILSMSWSRLQPPACAAHPDGPPW